MKRIEIAPGLEVTERMYDNAAHGMSTWTTDGQGITWESFTRPDLWTMVPDDQGDAYKAEFVWERTADRTLKVNLWFAPDLRGGELSKPHSHPWAFRARILMGGYSEDRYDPDGAGAVRKVTQQHGPGGVNDVPLTTYHEVTDIHEPGQTLTLMVCGPGRQGAWGYLDVHTGEHLPVEPDPLFRERLLALNPHKG